MKEQQEAWHNWIEAIDQRPRPATAASSEVAKARFLFPAAGFKEVDIKNKDEELEKVVWENLAERLSDAQTLNTCTFYRFLGIYEGTDIYKNRADTNKPNRFRPQASPISSTTLFERTAYKLRSGNTYSLRLRFFSEPSKNTYPSSLSPRASSDVLKLSQPLHASEGLTTSTYILINCSTVYRNEYVTLTIADDKDEEGRSAQAEFLILVEPQRGLFIQVIALLFFGALAAGIDKELIESVTTTGGFLYNNAARIDIVTTLIGPVLVGLGAYLGFGKLPT